MEQLLELFLELEWLFFAQVLEPGPVTGECGGGHRGIEYAVRDLVELQLEEDQVGGDAGELLGDVSVEFGAGRICLVAGIEQTGVGAEAAQQVGQALIGDDGLGKGIAAAGGRGQLALPGVLDAFGLGCRGLDIALDLGGVGGGV